MRRLHSRSPDPPARPDADAASLLHRLRRLEEENARLRERSEALERANARLSLLSATDELTGLPNQRAFRNTIARELKRALRSHGELALVLFDIDDFKTLNDRYGHAVGDAILAQVGRVMRSAVREVDLLARYGGEEFALLAPGTAAAGALALAEKIRLAVGRAPLSVIGLDGRCAIRVTLSAGVASFAGDERRLFNDADRALYRAKAAGKDCAILDDGSA